MIIIITLGIMLIVASVSVIKYFRAKNKVEDTSEYLINNLDILKNEGYEIEETEDKYILRKDNRSYEINKYD